METIRECRYCYKPLTRKPDERKHSFKDRNYCDKLCATKSIAERVKRKRSNKSIAPVLSKRSISTWS